MAILYAPCTTAVRAGFWIRVVAALVDLVVLWSSRSSRWAWPPRRVWGATSRRAGAPVAIGLFTLIFAALYVTAPARGRRARRSASSLVGVRVVLVDGERRRPSAPRSCASSATACRSPPLGLGFAMAGLRRDRRALARPDRRHARRAPAPTRAAIRPSRRRRSSHPSHDPDASAAAAQPPGGDHPAARSHDPAPRALETGAARREAGWARGLRRPTHAALVRARRAGARREALRGVCAGRRGERRLADALVAAAALFDARALLRGARAARAPLDAGRRAPSGRRCRA